MTSTEGRESVLQSTVDRVTESLATAPTSDIRYVKSTRNTAAGSDSNADVRDTRDNGSFETAPERAPELDDVSAIDNRSVYVAQVTGIFTKAGHDGITVHGDTLEIVVDAKTGQLTDWGITNGSPGLDRLGPPRKMKRS
jgi:hypothetical protein